MLPESIWSCATRLSYFKIIFTVSYKFQSIYLHITCNWDKLSYCHAVMHVRYLGDWWIDAWNYRAHNLYSINAAYFFKSQLVFLCLLTRDNFLSSVFDTWWTCQSSTCLVNTGMLCWKHCFSMKFVNSIVDIVTLLSTFLVKNFFLSILRTRLINVMHFKVLVTKQRVTHNGKEIFFALG